MAEEKRKDAEDELKVSSISDMILIYSLLQIQMARTNQLPAFAESQAVEEGQFSKVC